MKRLFKNIDAVRTAQILFLLNALIWVALGIASLLRLSQRGPISAGTAIMIVIMMFGNAGAMVMSGVGLGAKQRGFYFLALTVLLVNIVLTFTDQVGLLDFLTLALDLVLLGLLIVTRKQFTRRNAQG